MTTAKRVGPDLGRDDLRTLRMVRRRARLMAALGDLEVLHADIGRIWDGLYWLGLVTSNAEEITPDQLELHEAANSWLEYELAAVDPDVLAKRLLMSAEVVLNQSWRRELIDALKGLVGDPGFPPSSLSPRLQNAAELGSYKRLGDRRLATFAWKLVRAMRLPPEQSKRITALLRSGVVAD